MLSIGRTLSFLVMMGACKGLTLTRDETQRVGGQPAGNVAKQYPLNAATGIHPSQNIELAFTMDQAASAIVLHPGLTSQSKPITLTHTTNTDFSRNFPIYDTQVNIVMKTGTGSDHAANMAFVTINPEVDLMPGTYRVEVEAGAFQEGASDASGQNPGTLETSTKLGASDADTLAFTVQELCENSDMSGTDAEDKTACTTSRPDCIWTGTACEARVISVTGASGGAGANKLCDGGAGQGEGTQHNNEAGVNGGTGPTGCAQVECVNGDYVSRGLRNGKPVFSKDWDISLAHGGAYIQFEDATSAALTLHRTGGTAGWVAVCGGAPRFGSPTTTTADVTAAVTWTNVLAQSTDDTDAFAVGPFNIVEATCIKPTVSTGYSLPTASTGDWTRGAFAPTGISCASGYSGTAKATNCKAVGEEITLSGCSKNSRRRRRKHKHNRHWHNNDAAAPFNPFWWFR